MHLTLFIPDLLWQDFENGAAFEFSGAEHLARFLSLAESAHRPMARTASWESQLANLFGFSEDRPPLAALRSLGDQLPATGQQVCTDPVYLDFMQQALVLSPIDPSTLSPTDIAELLESLNTEFTGQGRFVANQAQGDHCHWVFLPENDQSNLPNLAASSRLAGRRVDADETRELLGRDGLVWINRIQMCLNQHPVNQAREGLGLPLINSLWPWGTGTLQDIDIPGTRFSSATGETALLSGLCQTTQTPLKPNRGFTTDDQQPLVVDLQLTNAISHEDLTLWQAATTRLICDWIAPALSSLTERSGSLQSCTIISPNAHLEQRWTLRRNHRNLRGNLLQRCLSLTPKNPTLAALVRQWSA